MEREQPTSAGTQPQQTFRLAIRCRQVMAAASMTPLSRESVRRVIRCCTPRTLAEADKTKRTGWRWIARARLYSRAGQPLRISRRHATRIQRPVMSSISSWRELSADASVNFVTPSASALTFALRQGADPAPQTITLSSGGAPVTFTAGSSQPWLRVVRNPERRLQH